MLILGFYLRLLLENDIPKINEMIVFHVGVSLFLASPAFY